MKNQFLSVGVCLLLSAGAAQAQTQNNMMKDTVRPASKYADSMRNLNRNIGMDTNIHLKQNPGADNPGKTDNDIRQPGLNYPGKQSSETKKNK